MARRYRLGWAFCLLAVLEAGAQAKPDALKLYRDGAYEQARVACMGELEADSSNMEAYVVLTWSLVALERFADAELYATRAYETVRKDPRIVETLGEATYYQGKNSQALAHFQNYINLLPDGTRLGIVYFYMGEIYLREERWNHADIAFCTAVQYEPNNASWWTRLGYARERNGDWAYALEAYDRALQIDSASLDARGGRARVAAKVRA